MYYYTTLFRVCQVFFEKKFENFKKIFSRNFQNRKCLFLLIFSRFCDIIINEEGMNLKEKNLKIIRGVLLTVFIFAVGYLCFRYFLPFCKTLGTEQGREVLAEWIEHAGIFAPLVFVLLMAVQIVIAIIPGGPLEITAGVLFGGWLGTLLTVTGAFLGTASVYTLVKKFGRPLVNLFISEKKMKTYSVLEDEDKLEFWVFILFLIPGIPKDLLTYIVPLTKIDGKQFLLLSTLARFPALTASVLMGDSLSEGRYGICIAIACIAAIAVFVGFQIKKHILKGKENPK